MGLRIHSTEGRPPEKQPQPAGTLTRRVRAFAGELIARQTSGVITARDLADSLNADGVASPLSRAWSAKTVFRMLRHGKGMGLPFILRSRSEAASARRPSYSSRSYHRQQQDRAWKEFRAQRRKAENDSLIIAPALRQTAEELD